MSETVSSPPSGGSAAAPAGASHAVDAYTAAQAAQDAKATQGVGYCNITKCCTNVCPESITITDNAIIPLKERVVDEFYDPLRKLLRVFRRSP